MRHSRHQLMKQLFYDKKQLTCQELCEHFGTSIETVRRDLAELEKTGIVRRIYGGAVLTDTYTYPDAISPWKDRSAAHLKEKQAIAAEVVKWIPDNATIALDSGTTMMEIAKRLPAKQNLRVITNDLRVASIISANSNHEVCLVGGTLKQSDLITLGYLSTEFLNNIVHIDIAVLTADGFDTKVGLYDHNYNMCNLKKAYIERAQQVFAVMDSSKVGQKAPYRVCEPKKIDLFILDDSISPAEMSNFRNRKMRFITVKAE